MLAVSSPDLLLGTVASIGLAAAAGTCLVVGLDLPYLGRRSLSDLASEGPMTSELSPGRTGVAMIPAGPLDGIDVGEVVGRLSSRWPAVVVGGVGASSLGLATVPVVPLYPGRLLAQEASNCVWQPVVAGVTPPSPGPVLPRIRPSVLKRLLDGTLPRRSRWVRAWTPIWEMPWA